MRSGVVASRIEVSGENVKREMKGGGRVGTPGDRGGG